MIIIFVLHIIHKYKSVIMKFNCHFEHFHVPIKIYINIKIIKKITLANGIQCSILLHFVRKRKSYVKISFSKHESNLGATILSTTFYAEALQFDNCNINIYLL